MSRSDPIAGGWFRPALWLVGAVTALRLALLSLNRTDLFMDESQYWLWGQSFAFGYYSKPPLIAWVIGLGTWLGGDTAYFVRAPFALLHGLTAMILAALAARIAGPRNGAQVALLTAATYVTLPMVAVGSLLASTDSVMAPFFAAALYFHHRLTRSPSPMLAVLTGLCLGAAFLAKYAALYFLIGAGLAALAPSQRIGWRNLAILLAAFAFVAAPNLVWNATHGFTTVSHTADNIDWVRQDSPLSQLSLANLFQFLGAQFGVAGPLVFATLLAALARPRIAGTDRAMLAFALPPLAIVSLQALIDKAFANWAAAAYFPGSVLVVLILSRRPRLMALSLGINGAISLILPVLTLFPNLSIGGPPLLDRWTGQAEMSRQILDLSIQNDGMPIVSERRDILADMFFTGAERNLPIYAVPPKGRPMNHYEQTYPLPPDVTGKVLYISARPPACPSEALPLIAGTGAYAKARLMAYVTDAGCFRAP